MKNIYKHIVSSVVIASLGFTLIHNPDKFPDVASTAIPVLGKVLPSDPEHKKEKK